MALTQPFLLVLLSLLPLATQAQFSQGPASSAAAAPGAAAQAQGGFGNQGGAVAP